MFAASPDPAGYGPTDLQSAYDLPSDFTGYGKTVAVIAGADLASAEADLATYRDQFGLPACTTENGCFLKVNQSGDASPLPAADSTIGQTIDLDLQMVSAICPNCGIGLVEANDTTFDNMFAATMTAVHVLGVGAVVVGYSEPENKPATDAQADQLSGFGTFVAAAAGDSGMGTSFPASVPAVAAVGGTTLTHANNDRHYSETVWANTGSGCTSEPAPPGQQDADCSNRVENDLSAVADPATGVAVYDSSPPVGTTPGWQVMGGTAAATSIVASAAMLAGGMPADDQVGALYRHADAFNDVTSGSNGSCGNSLCNAGTGYDGPSGLGTLAGTAALRTIAGVGQFDDRGSTDIAVWRPSNGTWYVQNCSCTHVQYGTRGDIPVVENYYGDGFMPPAVWRPSNGTWYVLGSPHFQYGTAGDIPVPGDYFGEGVADLAVWRPSNGTWYIDGLPHMGFGTNGDVPVPGHYFGDAEKDIAVWRPSNGTWYIMGGDRVQYGVRGDVPVPGDYDGDGITDLALWRPSNGNWYILDSSTGASTHLHFGTKGDIPQPGDYSGEGVTEIAVFRPSTGTWWFNSHPNVKFGGSGDQPVPLPYASARLS